MNNGNGSNSKPTKEELQERLRRKIAQKSSTRVPKRAIDAYKKSRMYANDVMDQVTMMVSDYNRLIPKYKGREVQLKQLLKKQYSQLFEVHQQVFMAIANGNIRTQADVNGVRAALEFNKELNKQNLTKEQRREKVSQEVFNRYNHLLGDTIKELTAKQAAEEAKRSEAS